MSLSIETLNDLIDSHLNAHRAQKKAIKHAKETTQPAVDVADYCLKEKTDALVLRYYDFKKKFFHYNEMVLSFGRNVAAESPLFHYVKPNSFVFKCRDEENGRYIFVSTENSEATLSIPVEYFLDPDAWEANFTATIKGIHDLKRRVEKALGIPMLTVFDSSTEALSVFHEQEYLKFTNKVFAGAAEPYIINRLTGKVYKTHNWYDIENNRIDPVIVVDPATSNVS